MSTKNIVEIVVPELGESIVQGNIASITKQKGSFRKRKFCQIITIRD